MPGIFSTQILNLRLLPRLPHGRPALRPWATRGPYQWILPEVGPRWAQTLPLGWGVTNFKVNTKSLEYLICQTLCRFQSKKLLFTQFLPALGLHCWTQAFSNCRAWALDLMLSSCGTQIELLCGMWDFPKPGIELVSLALQARFLSPGPLGKLPVSNTSSLAILSTQLFSAVRNSVY